MIMVMVVVFGIELLYQINSDSGALANPRGFSLIHFSPEAEVCLEGAPPSSRSGRAGREGSTSGLRISFGRPVNQIRAFQ